MGIVIEQLHEMDGYHRKHFGVVRHNGHLCDAVLVGPYDRLLTLLHTEVSAELELNEIISAEVNLPKDDQRSGIFPLPGKQVVIDGTVYNEEIVDDTFSLFDIYIQNGADFLNVTSEQLRINPYLESRIRIVGKGLHVYPLLTEFDSSGDR